MALQTVGYNPFIEEIFERERQKRVQEQSWVEGVTNVLRNLLGRGRPESTGGPKDKSIAWIVSPGSTEGGSNTLPLMLLVAVAIVGLILLTR